MPTFNSLCYLKIFTEYIKITNISPFFEKLYLIDKASKKKINICDFK